jgi:uroporphyrinogen III methyltransferase/synthase
VLITRAREQGSQMEALLESLGARVICFPMIEIAEPESWEQLDAAICRLDQYHWIIFTSSNAVRFFYRRVRELRAEIPPALKVFAIGPATAKSIQQEGVRVDLVASESRAEGALEAIIGHLGGPDQVAGLSFLLPRAKRARELLPAELQKLGARVEPVEAYRTVKPKANRAELMRSLSEVDAVVFTSPSTVSNFAELVGNEDLSQLLGNVAIACIGPTTAAAAAQRRLWPVIKPDAYNSEALVEAIARYFARTGCAPER